MDRELRQEAALRVDEQADDQCKENLQEKLVRPGTPLLLGLQLSKVVNETDGPE